MCFNSITMFLQFEEFGPILSRSEQSVPLPIFRVGPYFVALACVPPFIVFLGVWIFWFLDFRLFQVKVQLVSKWMMNYIVIWCWDCSIRIVCIKLDLIAAELNEIRVFVVLTFVAFSADWTQDNKTVCVTWKLSVTLSHFHKITEWVWPEVVLTDRARNQTVVVLLVFTL